MRKPVLVLMGLLTLVVPGCGTSVNSTASVAGTWVGTMTDSVLGTGKIYATISQSDSVLSGEWYSYYPNPINNFQGTLSGSVSGSSVAAMLTSNFPILLRREPQDCDFNVTATVNGNQLSGTYASVFCNVAVTGSIHLTTK